MVCSHFCLPLGWAQMRSFYPSSKLASQLEKVWGSTKQNVWVEGPLWWWWWNWSGCSSAQAQSRLKLTVNHLRRRTGARLSCTLHPTAGFWQVRISVNSGFIIFHLLQTNHLNQIKKITADSWGRNLGSLRFHRASSWTRDACIFILFCSKFLYPFPFFFPPPSFIVAW